MDDDELDEIVGALLAAQQLAPQALSRLRGFAHDVRTTYVASDPQRRRAWALAGTRVASARRLDELGRLLAVKAVETETRSGVSGAISALDESGVLPQLLALPDVDSGAWRFRRSQRGGEVEVDLSDALGRWTSGQPLSQMADDLLPDVPDRTWRLEQMVDCVSRGFGHAISWMISVVVERANAILAEVEVEPICPALPLFVRFGVNSSAALQLVTRTVRSRDVAVRVARLAYEAGVEDQGVMEWLDTQPVERWPSLFAARPSDVLDLLDAMSDPRTDSLRLLLDTGEVHLQLNSELPEGAVELVIATRDDDLELVELHAVGGERLSVLPARLQADLRTVLATGIDVEANISRGSTLTLRIGRGEAHAN